jgi:hypothetical protein
MEWAPVYHVKGWGKFKRHYGDFCTGADKLTVDDEIERINPTVIGSADHSRENVLVGQEDM